MTKVAANESNQKEPLKETKQKEFQRPSAEGAPGGRQPPPSRYIQTSK